MTGRAPAVRTSASDRVARLLAAVAWIAAQDGPTLSEVCERFGVTRPKLVEDLAVLMLVGVPPYTPDTLTRMWHKLAESAGVRPIRLHDTRHSCGTALRL